MINWKIQPTPCGGLLLRIFDMCTGSGVTIVVTDIGMLTRMLDDIADGAEKCMPVATVEPPEAFAREFPEMF